MNDLLSQLEEEQEFLQKELQSRTDISNSIESSKYNMWLVDQLAEINSTIYEIINKKY